jgi:hypothetical protein
MLVEINKSHLTNFDVRTAIRTLRDYGIHPFKSSSDHANGYYFAYLTESQYLSLLTDPKIVDAQYYAASHPIVGMLPAIYGCVFFRVTEENQPARFLGSHLPMGEQEVELAKVNP